MKRREMTPEEFAKSEEQSDLLARAIMQMVQDYTNNPAKGISHPQTVVTALFNASVMMLSSILHDQAALGNLTGAADYAEHLKEGTIDSLDSMVECLHSHGFKDGQVVENWGGVNMDKVFARGKEKPQDWGL